MAGFGKEAVFLFKISHDIGVNGSLFFFLFFAVIGVVSIIMIFVFILVIVLLIYLFDTFQVTLEPTQLLINILHSYLLVHILMRLHEFFIVENILLLFGEATN